eukprot:EG_transcript_20378
MPAGDEPSSLTQRTDALIAKQLQDEEQELFLEAQRRAQEWDADRQAALAAAQDSGPFWSRLKGLTEGTMATLYNVGDFFFPTAHSFDEAYVTADRQRLLQRLAFHGLKERAVEGDGNCQFRALADQLWRRQDSHREVRRLVAARLRFHPEQYAPFVISEDYDAYVARMAKEGEWGDHVTLQAAADVFGVEIVLVTSFADERSIISIKPLDWEGKDPDSSRVVQTLHLSFYAEIHYNSIDVRLAEPCK